MDGKMTLISNVLSIVYQFIPYWRGHRENIQKKKLIHLRSIAVLRETPRRHEVIVQTPQREAPGPRGRSNPWPFFCKLCCNIMWWDGLIEDWAKANLGSGGIPSHAIDTTTVLIPAAKGSSKDTLRRDHNSLTTFGCQSLQHFQTLGQSRRRNAPFFFTPMGQSLYMDRG